MLFSETALSPAHTEGEGITQGHEHHEGGHGSHLEAAYPTAEGWGAQHRKRERVSTRCVSKWIKNATKCVSELYPGNKRKEHLSIKILPHKALTLSFFQARAQSGLSWEVGERHVKQSCGRLEGVTVTGHLHEAGGNLQSIGCHYDW